MRGTLPSAVAAPLGEIRVIWLPRRNPMRCAIRLPMAAVPGVASAASDPSMTWLANTSRASRSAGRTPRTRAPDATPLALAITWPST